MTRSISANSRPRAMTFARSQAGFNLLELMIVVAIIGILTGLAYTSYADSVVKSRRKAATSCMLEEGQFLERRFTTNLTYVGSKAALIASPLQCQTDLVVFYKIEPSAEGVRTYTITATPYTAKQKDPLCGTMTINQLGAKTKTGTATQVECFP